MSCTVFLTTRTGVYWIWNKHLKCANLDLRQMLQNLSLNLWIDFFEHLPQEVGHPCYSANLKFPPPHPITRLQTPPAFFLTLSLKRKRKVASAEHSSWSKWADLYIHTIAFSDIQPEYSLCSSAPDLTHSIYKTQKKSTRRGKDGHQIQFIQITSNTLRSAFISAESGIHAASTSVHDSILRWTLMEI